MYIDSHCHLDDPRLSGQVEAVVARARAVGIGGFVVAGVDPASWARQRALAQARPEIVWASGLHPVRAARWAPAQVDRALRSLPAAFEGPAPAIALGELGLDSLFAPKESLDRQASALRAQLDLARALRVPIVLHVVGPGAHGRVVALLRADGLPEAGGVVHAFSGSAEIADLYVGLGLHLGFAGPVARRRARRARAAAAQVPGERLLIETDAPDLAPPGWGGDHNEPAALPHVAAALADIRGCTAAAMLRLASANARRLFPGLPQAAGVS